MSQITFLALDERMLELAQRTLKDDCADIRFETGLSGEGVARVRALQEQGTEIVITRGITAAAIHAEGIDVVIVEIAVTAFDVIRSIERARHHGKQIAVVVFPSMAKGLDSLASAMGIDLRIHILASEQDADATVAAAIGAGANAIVGGYIAEIAARKQGCPFELIENGQEGILQAVAEARLIADGQNLEKAKAAIFRAVLDYSYDGIISADRNGKIFFFNRSAERIAGRKGQELIGKAVGDAWPGLGVADVIASRQEELGQIIPINGTDVLCNKVPIIIRDECVGVVVTFQDIAQIQKTEAHVRRRIFASGHVAHFSFADIVTESDALKQTIETAKDYALSASSILITGETGCGKELFAQSCHNYSHCHDGPFVAINCAALPTQILESELFGYVAGAFTGANPKGKPGVFEMAHGGTIFLDEIGEIDLGIQGKLLRVLEEKRVMRLGSDRLIPVSVRVIAATNKNLKQLVEQGGFRSDLYYRLNVLQLRLPPLRARKEDIGPLAKRFLREENGLGRRQTLSAPALKALQTHDWPGNVRELRNIVQRLLVTSKQHTIDAATVHRVLIDEDDSPRAHAESPAYDEAPEIRKALAQARGKRAEAARLLGIDRSTLWRKIKQYGIT
ncbi:sigma 54-interacting transcriptional regulator [Propionivibrio dicarboxylicus]|uniref:PAS domain S-box-containing protein n=1 Tax=Propionivibrio dicarboxylicus TaxID=83767 RepID=A0A1G8I2U8_9RHOO|nr:sigma 54-interacting transcriptional regulator [Propionivibrio dicarboxylicus]SDI12970.1 PAS domain S-box-containing protein [Propionivibrio dicarboxylicus]